MWVRHFSRSWEKWERRIVRTGDAESISEKDTTMKTLKTLLFVAILVTGTALFAASPERYLHVRVSNPTTHELVRVNLPLSLAEKVILAIHNEQLKNGKVEIGDFKANEVDVRAILDALKTAPEGEFVTVQEPDSDVRVAKEQLISETTDNQLNISAAIKALENIGDATLVTVVSSEESVRIWIDSNNATEK